MGTNGIRPEIAGGSPSQVVLSDRVRGAGNSSPSTIKGGLLISSATRVSVGRYRLFLGDTFPQLESIHADVQDTNYGTLASRKTAKVISHAVDNATAASRYVEVAVTESGFKVDEFTDAPAAATAGLKAATATTVAIQTWLTADLIGAGLTELAARPRSVTFTTAGATAADAPANAVVTGTDINGDALTETVTLSQVAGTAESVKAFKTITSVVFAAGDGAGATIAMGYGNKFGLSRKAKTRAGAVMRGTEISAGSVVTNGTLVAAETSAPNGTYTPNTAPNGSNDYAIAYETEGDADLTSNEWLHVTLNLRNTSQGV